MSKTASIGLVSSNTLFGRLTASVDRLLTASSRIAVRNADLPYFGLRDCKHRIFGFAPDLTNGSEKAN